MATMLRHVENEDIIGDSQHGFTKGEFCLTHLMVFCDKVTTQERGTDVIYLSFCKAFDTVLQGEIISKLVRHGFDVWTTQWIRN